MHKKKCTNVFDPETKLIKDYKVSYVKTDYGAVHVKATSKREAIDKVKKMYIGLLVREPTAVELK